MRRITATKEEIEAAQKVLPAKVDTVYSYCDGCLINVYYVDGLWLNVGQYLREVENRKDKLQ